VTDIESELFSGCSSLSKITIPDSVTSIVCNAFNDTAYYNNAENWDNGILYIGNTLIVANSDVVSGDVSVKEGTRIISDYAFEECSGLSEITLPDSVKSIGYGAFYGCGDLSKITLSDGLTYIDSDAFVECSSLSEITIPDSVTGIGSYAFNDTAYYNNAENWDNGILYIGNALVQVKRGVVSGNVSVKEGTRIISADAFENCSGLSEITLPDSVTNIGWSAFYYCDSLSKITIPDSVTSIEEYTF
jgi:hypothetical protein